MLRKTICALLIATLLLPGKQAHAQVNEAQQLALNIQKLAQFRKILKNMYQAYTILRQGYDKVKDITSGNYSLHEAFLDGLMNVSPEVRNYSRVKDIINSQSRILKEYRSSFQRFKAAGVFSPEEITYMGKVYDQLLDRSIQNVNELTMVLTAGKLRMSDDERMTAIDRLASEIEDQLGFLRSFNNKTGVLGQQRIKDRQQNKSVERLYQIK